MAANTSWTRRSPRLQPSHCAPPLRRKAVSYRRANGMSRIAMSLRAQRQLSGIRVSTRRVRACEVGVGEPITFDIFFDYTCPFVFRASRLVDAVQRSGARRVEARWRYFSLTQVNSKDEGWTVWEAPASEHVRGRLAFAAAEAARRQHRFAPMHEALLLARHRDRADIDDRGVVERLAAEAGLDLERFRRDLDDPSILQA